MEIPSLLLFSSPFVGNFLCLTENDYLCVNVHSRTSIKCINSKKLSS